MENTNTFQVQLDYDHFNKNDTIVTPNNTKLFVLDVPKTHYNKWYWKILNWLTFKLFFNVSYTYTVKPKFE